MGDELVRTPLGELHLLDDGAVLAGRELSLTPSSLAVLRLLASAGGKVVSRDRILTVLPGSSTDAHAADVAVSRLRDALGQPTIVQTVIKRGYRLVLAG